MRLGDLDALCDEFKRRQRAALRWKEEAILDDNEESKIRADAILSFLSEVKLTIDNAPTIMPKEFEPLMEAIIDVLPAIVEKTVPAIVEKIERPTGEWIPVSERLPNQYDRILVTIHVPTRKPVVRSGFYHDGLFHIDNGDCWKVTDMEIVAWMPMPEPYKEVKKNEQSE